jgi:predicted transposase YdaD
MNGAVQHRHPEGNCYLEFRYQVVRVWQRPVESFLTGGLGTLPLAPVSSVSRDELPAVIRRMDERLQKESPPAKSAMLWAATYVLMGLRYPEELTQHLLAGVRAMKESVTYQAIIREGKEIGLTEGVVKGMAQGAVQEARRILLRQGRIRFGTPEPEATAALDAITDVAQLEELSERLLKVSSWAELLGQPSTKRKSNGKRRKA